MTFAEFMAEAEFHRPKDAGDYAGSLTRGTVEALEEWMETWDNASAA